MSAARMHEGEVDTGPDLIRRLLAAQFPWWADLPITRVRSSGTDNAIYRLGERLAARLPRIAGASGLVDKEHAWLPLLGPHLPLAVPRPQALGEPGAGYPWRWAVVEWLPGENADEQPPADAVQTAVDLTDFISALEGIDPAGGPPPGFGRGVALGTRDAPTRQAIAALGDRVDAAAVTAAWEAALALPEWRGPAVWIHGDLGPTNLLVRDGRLSAVIDFGCLGVGDPAGDLIIAWSFFSGEARAAFREALQVDESAWFRGRGWALSIALIALPYYWDTNPTLAHLSRRTIAAVLADHRVGDS